jgi:hypothetical protein
VLGEDRQDMGRDDHRALAHIGLGICVKSWYRPPPKSEREFAGSMSNTTKTVDV